MQDATAVLNQISGALDALAVQSIAAIPQDQSFMEIWGWNMPAINRHEFADYLRSPISMIQNIDGRNIEDEDFQVLSLIPPRIAYFQANALPQLPGGNAFHVYLTARSMIDSLTQLLSKYTNLPIDWTEVESNKLLPASQTRRLKQIGKSIDRLTNASVDLDSKITLINDAHATAEALPADLDSLADARKEYDAAMKIMEQNRGKAVAAKEAAEARLAEIDTLKTQAEQLVKNTEAAQAAATMQGLGAAFGNKANSLSYSTWGLGALLALTLGVGACISSSRIDFIHKLMLQPNVSMQLLYINFMLTIASIAGPIWFAWILTKQIGQRFRLSEDYAYKASVAKAYEGYRVEAVRIDPDLEKRLFRSVLDRIDEAPLRHVEAENHGSPWHELISRKIRADNKSPETPKPSGEAE